MLYYRLGLGESKQTEKHINYTIVSHERQDKQSREQKNNTIKGEQVWCYYLL